MPQLMIPAGYREKKAAEQKAEDRRVMEIAREIEADAAKLYQERVEAVDQDDPMRSAFTALKRAARGKQFTYLGRLVEPDMTFDDVVKKIPHHELEIGARIAWAGGRLLVGRQAGSLYGIGTRGPHFWQRMAADSEERGEILSELGTAIEQGFEKQPDFIKRIIRVFIGAGVGMYEDLQHLAKGERPPNWTRVQEPKEGGLSAVLSNANERLKMIEDKARDVGWNR